MKPSLSQRFFASKWVWILWFSFTSLGTAAYCLNVAEFQIEYLRDWSMTGTYLLISLTAAPLGLALGIFPGGMVLGILLHFRSMMNGGPFKPGDTIQVIGGIFDGRVTKVYSGWQGNSVRVELGEDAKREFKDVFSPHQLIKVPREK